MAKLQKSNEVELLVDLDTKVLGLGVSVKPRKLGIFTIFKIMKKYWAPGIWAGSEGFKIYTRPPKRINYVVVGIDLYNRIIIARSIP